MFGSPVPAARGLASGAGLIQSTLRRFPMNTELIEQNVHRLLGAMTGAATTAMVAVGDQPGLYRALTDTGCSSRTSRTSRTSRSRGGTAKVLTAAPDEADGVVVGRPQHVVQGQWGATPRHRRHPGQ